MTGRGMQWTSHMHGESLGPASPDDGILSFKLKPLLSKFLPVLYSQNRLCVICSQPDLGFRVSESQAVSHSLQAAVSRQLPCRWARSFRD